MNVTVLLRIINKGVQWFAQTGRRGKCLQYRNGEGEAENKCFLLQAK